MTDNDAALAHAIGTRFDRQFAQVWQRLVELEPLPDDELDILAVRDLLYAIAEVSVLVGAVVERGKRLAVRAGARIPPNPQEAR